MRDGARALPQQAGEAGGLRGWGPGLLKAGPGAPVSEWEGLAAAGSRGRPRGGSTGAPGREGRWPGKAAPPDAAQQSAFRICPPCLAPAVPRPPSRRDGRQHRGAAGHGAGQPRGRCSARSLCPIPRPPRPRPPLPVPWPWLRHLLSAPSLRGAAGLAPNVPYREEPETLGSSPTSQREIVPE